MVENRWVTWRHVYGISFIRTWVPAIPARMAMILSHDDGIGIAVIVSVSGMMVCIK